MRFSPRMATLATVLAAVLIRTSAAQDPALRAVAHYGPRTGTVVAVDPRARTFQLLTGVGHALRVTLVHYPAEMGIRARGAESSISTLTRGCIVRVECRTAGARTEATSIELLQSPQTPTP